MTFEPGPTPAQVALTLFLTLAGCFGAMLLVGWLRRCDSRFASAAAGLLFFLAAAVLHPLALYPPLARKSPVMLALALAGCLAGAAH